MKARNIWSKTFKIFKILLIFSLTGITSMKIGKMITDIFELKEMAGNYYIPLFIVLITPFYYTLLVFYSFIFGEREYFSKKANRILNFFKRKPKESKS